MEIDANPDKQYMNEHVKPYFLDAENERECILLLHGFTGSPADLAPLAAYLNNDGKGYPVCVPLLPGHGTQMEDMLHCNWKNWVVYATRELRKLQERYEKVDVIGFSMGGNIALCLASKFKVNRVVSIATPIRIRNKLNYIAEFLSIFRKYTYWKVLKPYEGEALYDYQTGYTGMPVRAIAQLRKLTIASFNRLHRIREPVLIIQPLKDKVVHLKSPFIIFDNVKSDHKELLLVENSCHNVLISPDRLKVFKAVDAFLGREIHPKEPIP